MHSGLPCRRPHVPPRLAQAHRRAEPLHPGEQLVRPHILIATCACWKQIGESGRAAVPPRNAVRGVHAALTKAEDSAAKVEQLQAGKLSPAALIKEVLTL